MTSPFARNSKDSYQAAREMHQIDSTRCGPLVRSILEQPDLELVQRPIDLRWYYSDALQIATNGFLPTSRSLYVGVQSTIAAALRNQLTAEWQQWVSAGWLEYESAFLVHDYLHVWTFEEAKSFFPNLRSYPRDVESARLFSFIWLLSEAVATIGLDFWFLARRSSQAANSYQLTTNYNPNVDGSYFGSIRINSPNFLSCIANGYLTGAFQGAENNPADQPLWLQREMRQGVKQRQLLVAWLSSQGVVYGDNLLTDTECYAEFVRHISETLWCAISTHSSIPFLPPKRTTPENFGAASLCSQDFRFINLLSMTSWRDLVSVDLVDVSVEQFGYLVNQYVGAFWFDTRCSSSDLDSLIRSRRVSDLFKVCESMSVITDGEVGPKVIFLPN